LYLDKALLPGHLVGRGGAKGPFEVNLSLMRPRVPSFSLLKVPEKKTKNKTKQRLVRKMLKLALRSENNANL